MRIYNNQEEVEKDVVDWVLKVDDDIKFNFDLKMKIDIVAFDIYTCNINCNNIKANNIKANYIKANNINCYDIKAIKIDINDINAHNIEADEINANDINYYGICIAYETFKCKSIKWRRDNSKHFCLDSEIEIKE